MEGGDERDALQMMKEIVSAAGGGPTPDAILKGFLQAAKGDLNVALDHYFNSSSKETKNERLPSNAGDVPKRMIQKRKRAPPTIDDDLIIVDHSRPIKGPAPKKQRTAQEEKMALIREALGYNHMTKEQLEQILEEHDWDVEASVEECLRWQEFRENNGADADSSLDEKEAGNNHAVKQERKGKRTKTWETDPTMQVGYDIRLPRKDARSLFNGNDAIVIDDDDVGADPDREGDQILDSWTNSTVEQDSEGWPKYLGTLECEAVLIGHAPLPVTTSIPLSASKYGSEVHVDIFDPFSEEKVIGHLSKSTSQYLAPLMLLGLISASSVVSRVHRGDMHLLVKVFIRREALCSPYDGYGEEPDQNGKKQTGGLQSHSKRDTFRKKKPFAQLLKALKAAADSEARGGGGERGEGGEHLPFFIPSLVGDDEDEEQDGNKSIEEKQEESTHFLDSIYGSDDGSVLGEMEPPDSLKSVLHPHQKQGLWWLVKQESKGASCQRMAVANAQGVIDLTGESKTAATEPIEAPELHPLWKKYVFPDGTPFYYNDFTGGITLEFPQRPRPPRGGILADDQGLGKTIQMIALMLAHRGENEHCGNKNEFGLYISNATLIVLPLTLISQWEQEIKMHTRGRCLRVVIYHGKDRWAISPRQIATADVVLTSYNTLAMEGGAADPKKKKKQTKKKTKKITTRDPVLTNVCWHRVILDEAHLIRTKDTQMARAVFQLEADRKWCLSGTPIQNKLNDLYSLINFLGVQPFCSYRYWKNAIEKPYHDNDPQSIYQLKNLLHSTLLRRTKAALMDQSNVSVDDTSGVTGVSGGREKTITEILEEEEKELQEIREEAEEAEEIVLGDDELSIVTSLSEKGKEKEKQEEKKKVKKRNALSLPPRTIETVVLEFSEKENHLYQGLKTRSMEKVNRFIQSGTVLKNYATVLELLLRMRQCCNHPALVVNSLTAKEVNAATTATCVIDLDAEGTDQWQSSTKIEALLRHLGQSEEEDPEIKSVVFSQWTSMLDLIETALTKEKRYLRNKNFLRLDGSMSSKDRERTIQLFARKKEAKVLLISTKAGGVGLNLTMASRVYMMDLAWNPATEDQAIDRVHRIGQTRPVIVRRFVIKDTVEDKIQLLQAKKANLVNSLGLSTGDKKQQKMEDLISIFTS